MPENQDKAVGMRMAVVLFQVAIIMALVARPSVLLLFGVAIATAILVAFWIGVNERLPLHDID